MFKRIKWNTAKMILKKFAYVTDPTYVSGDVITVEKAYQMLKISASTQLLKTGAVIGYNKGFYLSGYAMNGSDVTDLFL
jgi:hypothetical protein